MKSLIIIFISISALAGGISTNSEVLLKKDVKQVKLEKFGGGTRFTYCPDNTCDLLDIKTTDQSVAWDVGLVFLFYKSTYAILDDFKKKADILEHTQNLQKKYKVTCDNKESLADCLTNHFVKKYGVKQLFGRYDEGKMIIE